MTGSNIVAVVVGGESMHFRIPTDKDYEALVRCDEIGSRLFEILPESEAEELLRSMLMVLRKRFVDLNPDPLDRIIGVSAHERLHEYHLRTEAAEAEADELRRQLSCANNQLVQCRQFLRSLRELAKVHDLRAALKVLHGFKPNQDPKWQATDKLNQFCAELRVRIGDQLPKLLGE